MRDNSIILYKFLAINLIIFNSVIDDLYVVLFLFIGKIKQLSWHGNDIFVTTTLCKIDYYYYYYYRMGTGKFAWYFIVIYLNYVRNIQKK